MSLQSGCFPDGERIPACGPSHSSGRPHSPVRPVLPVRPIVPLNTSFDVLQLLRLIPRTNPNQLFEFRRYVISADQPVQRHVGYNEYAPFSVQEFTVLSTIKGDIYAIFEENSGFLRGIFTLNRRRAKINVKNGKVRSMRAEEIKECAVDQMITPNNFRIGYS